jgi:mannosyl-oligosaccharide glucosidase
VASWLATMDASGWIAREQILGAEARSRVPAQFQLQRSDIANPPTILLPVLVMAVDALCGSSAAARAASDDASSVGLSVSINADGTTASVSGASSAVPAPWDEERRRAFCHRHAAPSSTDDSSTGGSCRYACRTFSLGSPSTAPAVTSGASAVFNAVATAYPRLLLHYDWFLRTQAGPGVGSFRWRGATQDHCFASGLDDFPRGVSPTEQDEHVDLVAWMAMAAHILGDLGGLLGAPPSDLHRLEQDAMRYERRLLNIHWDREHRVFCDVGAVRERLDAGTDVQRRRPGPPIFDVGHVCHTGYVSIMPLLLRLLRPDSLQLGAMIDAVADDQSLLSRFGLRSLSRLDASFGTKEDYWRGAIWINMNWLAISALRHYGMLPGPHKQKAGHLSSLLSRAIVDTVVAEYTRTGFVWESYDSTTGQGRGTHPFTGWSALVALLVAERFPL